MIYMRTDANEEIATGHMMRCMTVAAELYKKGQRVLFLISDELSSVLLKENGFEYVILHTKWNCLKAQEEMEKMKTLLRRSDKEEGSMPLLLVDSYYVSNSYFEALHPFAKLAMFDDMGKERYQVDLLINYNLTYSMVNYENIYRNKRTRLLLGTAYMPLRKQFLEFTDSFHNLEDSERNLNGSGGEAVLNVLLICGGGDPFHILLKILQQASEDENFTQYCFHVVAGAYHPSTQELRLFEERFQNVRLYLRVKNMAELMASCDIAITAASTVLYECCALGLPTIFFVMADNQERDAFVFGKDKVMVYAGDIRDRCKDTISCILKKLQILCKNKELREHMSENTRIIVDGKGAVRIADALIQLLK